MGAGGKLYVSDNGNHLIREVSVGTGAAAAQVSTLAGTINTAGTTGTSGYADGAGNVARFENPAGLAVSGSTLYVADYANHRIRAIDLASTGKTVSTIAGSGTPEHADGAGSTAQFNNPLGLAVSGDTLYVADQSNHRIRAIDLASTNKTVRTIAGSGTPGHANGVGTAARFDGPSGLAVSGGTLYVTSGNLIRKLEYREVGS